MATQQASGGGRIQLAGLSKWYSDQQVLDDVDLEMLGSRVAADTRGLAGGCTVLVRPERLVLVPPAGAQVIAQVDHVVFAGAATHLHMRVGDHVLQAVVPNDGLSLGAVQGSEVGLLLKPDALRVLSD